MTQFFPKDEQEASYVIRDGGPFQITGHATKLLPDGTKATLSSRALAAIVEWSPEDLVVTVRAGTTLENLNDELATRNQCIPWNTGSVGGLVASNAARRSDIWPYDARYWVLGLRAIRGDGTAVRCGSKAVKNVAGYDVQKLFVGSWGSLGFITEVTFRVVPLRAIEDSREVSCPPVITSETRNADLMLAVKNVFDPERKFNPGVMGLF